ncbi:caspase, EACC1-associated type [Streptomyces sp. NPDC055722]
MGRRLALLIATYDYEDTGLRRLTAPAHDAEALAAVLQDPDIAGFEVTTMINEPHYRVGEAIADLYRDRRRDDLTLLYFTGHGLKDDEGRLYLAMTNTQRGSLLFTSLPAEQIDQAMSTCMSRQKVLILDCCYSGAFPAGRIAKGDTDVHTLERFQGRGRTVLTASDATQYSFEGNQPHGEAGQSVFTRYLVAGLRDGSADLDGDGDITLDELYSYVHDRVVDEMPQQRPKKQDNVEGRIVIARNVNWSLPAYLRQALSSPIPNDRLSALDGLAHLHRIGNDLVRRHVTSELHRLVDDDSRVVSAAAAALLRPTDAPAPSSTPATPSSTPATPSSTPALTPARPEAQPTAEVQAPPLSTPLDPAPSPPPTVEYGAWLWEEAKAENGPYGPSPRPQTLTPHSPERRRFSDGRKRALVATAAMLTVVLAVAAFAIARALTRDDRPPSRPTASASRSTPSSSVSALPTRPPRDPVADIADTPVNSRAILQLHPCSGSGLTLAVKSASDSYDKGESPEIVLTVRRDPADGPACRIDLGRTATILTMTDTNDKRLWSSADCPGTYTTPRWAKLADTTAVIVTFHWDRGLTRPHCASVTGAAGPGTYLSEAALVGQTTRTSFVLKAHTTVTSVPPRTSSSGSTNGGKESPPVVPSPMTEVPDVVGKTVKDATEVLQQYGFSTQIGNGPSSDDAIVASQDPAPNTNADPNTQVITLGTIEPTPDGTTSGNNGGFFGGPGG